MGAGAAMLVDVDVGMYTGAGRCIDGVDATMDAAAACVTITSLPMRSRYISRHTLANRSMLAMSAIKIFDS
jgi:hypothetical protein